MRRCPQCGNTDTFIIYATSAYVAEVSQLAAAKNPWRNIEFVIVRPREHSGPTWDEETGFECGACHHKATLRSFAVAHEASETQGELGVALAADWPPTQRLALIAPLARRLKAPISVKTTPHDVQLWASLIYALTTDSAESLERNRSIFLRAIDTCQNTS